MLVNLVEILKLAEEKKCAVGAFNTPNLECVNAVIAAAEKLNVPVIISHAELHEEVSPLAKIGPVMVQAANASGPVYTDPDEAVAFCRETGIDALAPSFGTAHGIYMSKPGTQAVKELLAKEDVTFFHDRALAAEKAMSADAEKAMRVFAGL